MREAFRVAVLTVGMALSAAPVSAQVMAVSSSHDAIVQGDYATAERLLTAEQRIFPDKAEVLINLAAVYANTGRYAAAESLYRHVLAQRDVLMDVSTDQTVSAHVIAQTGLSRITPTRTAAR